MALEPGYEWRVTKDERTHYLLKNHGKTFKGKVRQLDSGLWEGWYVYHRPTGGVDWRHIGRHSNAQAAKQEVMAHLVEDALEAP